jgi:outer membrane protein assembly factor BamE (lipoprotein component of BamABCDE complex)
MNRALLAVLSLSALLLSSCALARSNVNVPLDEAALSRLEIGMSAREVVELLGAPADVVQLGRRSAYRYDFINTKRSGLWLLVVLLYNEDTRADRAWVFFDENEKLTHAGITLQAEDTEYAMPWQDVHD